MTKILMKGNEAIGEAAIRAGCLNYFAYPITPQSEVAEYLARRLPEENGVFVQGESEVAVGYMLFGASAAGERVFTSSSSPGISLMSEAISYVAGAECPVVFINIMRGGPGLGGILPSQADYFQATKGGGHGDYRMLVLAPSSVQEAVEMVMRAFPMAEKYRNPVMILGDGLIGQMMEPVEFPEGLAAPPSNKDEWATNGMATRNAASRNLVKSVYLDPDTLNRHCLNLKSKYDRMAVEDVMYEPYHLDSDYRALLVSYGTMSRVCRTVIDRLAEEGIPVAMIRPQTLFPFPEEAIRKAASRDSCKHVFSIEMSVGQMVEDVRRVVPDTTPVEWYGKCGGEVPDPEEIMHIVKERI
ncbi:MAG: 3-methyl-2-oxobutanoate dehydrogenase subunit VorB [Desulfobacterales bacterium]|nr:MAG: 3-methyl-2-oxobutanoate dehydrogenase subunit VorB [Desulfobacterales bacterium]